jgi:hypothetical protein
MTTYGFNLSLDEQELWAIKEAMEFYLTSEATELRKRNPHLVKYYADIKLKELLNNGKLYKDKQLNSSNNFGQLSLEKSSYSSSKETLFAIVIQQLESYPNLLSLAGTPTADMFVEHPTLGQLILDCLINCLNNPNADISTECKNLLEDNKAREIFCSQISFHLYDALSK